MVGKNELFFLEEWVVIDFLRSKENKFSSNSKYIELLVSLVLNKFCERQFASKCWIGLEIQEKYKKEIPEKGFATLEEIDKIVTKKVEENTPVDVYICKMPTNGDVVSRGMAFQLKRFGKDLYKQDTDSLINFINCDCKEYGKTQASLIILIESSEEIDLQLLQRSIKTDGYPFIKIILIGLSNQKYIDFYGIWPESGSARYNLTTFNFDY